MSNSNRPLVPGAAGGDAGHFRWDTVPRSFRDWLKGRTDDIVGLAFRQAGDTVRIGVALEEARRKLKRGTYKAWVASELPFSLKTAHRYRQVAAAFAAFAACQFDTFDESALYVLAQHQTPQPAREHAVQLAQSGERITHALALEIVDSHRDVGTEEVRAAMRARRQAALEAKARGKDRPCLGRKADGALCGRVFLSVGGARLCPECKRQREDTRPRPADESPDAQRWRAFANLAAGCDLVRVERRDEGGPDGAGVSYAVTCHRPDADPTIAVHRELHLAVAGAAGETRVCSAPGCGPRPVGDFGADSNNPDGLMYRCRACEKARRAAMRGAGRKPPPSGAQAA